MLVLGVALLLSVSFFVAGFHARSVDPAGREMVKSLTTEILRQRSLLAELNAQHQQQVDALAARLAELHASSTRLNALGQRLVQAGKLEPTEFQFQDAVALGGPADSGALASSARDLRLGINQLEHRIKRQGSQLQALESLMMGRELDRTTTPAGWPVSQGWISSGFGRRTDPFSGQLANHHGIDFAGHRGVEVNSVASGVVIWAGRRSGYGQMVDVDHGNGYVTRYAHNEAILVELGERVVAGQTIAKMGDTGRASAPHVHFEVRKNGSPVNPLKFIRDLR